MKKEYKNEKGIKCSNCGKKVIALCSTCWRCRKCCDCNNGFERTIDGKIGKNKK